MKEFNVLKEYPYYMVSNEGDVYSKITNKLLKKIKSSNGYEFVNLYKNKKGKVMLVHQLVAIAFLNHNPSGQEMVVDHINGNKKDNRLCNLQVISQRDNSTKDKTNQKSGFFGVAWSTQNKKWQVRPRINGRKYLLGYYDCPEEAHKEYLKFTKYIDGIKQGKTVDEIKQITSKYKKITKKLA